MFLYVDYQRHHTKTLLKERPLHPHTETHKQKTERVRERGEGEGLRRYAKIFYTKGSLQAGNIICQGN